MASIVIKNKKTGKTVSNQTKAKKGEATWAFKEGIPSDRTISQAKKMAAAVAKKKKK